MPVYVLDTDLATLHLNGDPTVRLRAGAHSPGDVRLTIVTVQEMVAGWIPHLTRLHPPAHYRWAYAGLRRAIDYFKEVPLLDFDDAAAQEYARLRATYRRIGTYDLRIAAIALVNQAIVVTRNRQDFEQITGLTLEDWSR